LKTRWSATNAVNEQGSVLESEKSGTLVWVAKQRKGAVLQVTRLQR